MPQLRNVGVTELRGERCPLRFARKATRSTKERQHRGCSNNDRRQHVLLTSSLKKKRDKEKVCTGEGKLEKGGETT